MSNLGTTIWRCRHKLQELRALYFNRFAVRALIGEAAVCVALAVLVAFGKVRVRHAD